MKIIVILTNHINYPVKETKSKREYTAEFHSYELQKGKLNYQNRNQNTKMSMEVMIRSGLTVRGSQRTFLILGLENFEIISCSKKQ
jgi:hypothetical protein